MCPARRPRRAAPDPRPRGGRFCNVSRHANGSSVAPFRADRTRPGGSGAALGIRGAEAPAMQYQMTFQILMALVAVFAFLQLQLQWFLKFFSQ